MLPRASIAWYPAALTTPPLLMVGLPDPAPTMNETGIVSGVLDAAA
jgi:hypothetical protein